MSQKTQMKTETERKQRYLVEKNALHFAVEVHQVLDLVRYNLIDLPSLTDRVNELVSIYHSDNLKSS
jgi:hypothetical protein